MTIFVTLCLFPIWSMEENCLSASNTLAYSNNYVLRTLSYLNQVCCVGIEVRFQNST